MKVADIPDLKARTRAFALQTIRMYAALPKTTEAQILGRQLIRSGTSVGAHHRESVREYSDADFISKIEGGLQELEETAYWLELIGDAGILSPTELQSHYVETNQLIAIFVTIVRKVKNNG